MVGSMGMPELIIIFMILVLVPGTIAAIIITSVKRKNKRKNNEKDNNAQ
ncbi:MAG: hypothetical protein GY754_38915 [bacterium]|nr:hypothetical protein [bacterium]